MKKTDKIAELKAKEAVKEENKTELEVEVKSVKPIKLVVAFPGTDEDGNKTTLRLEHEAGTAEEVINQIALPKGINTNVRLTLTKGSTELLRSIPGFKARAIFEDKNVAVFKSIFRGLI